MPYASNAELPAHVRKLSSKKQRQWRSVWNSTYARTKDEGRAFRAANGVVGRKELDVSTNLTITRDDKSVRVTMYKGADDPDLPSHIAGLPLLLRSRWVNNYNWAVQETLDSEKAEERADEYTSVSVADLVDANVLKEEDHALAGSAATVHNAGMLDQDKPNYDGVLAAPSMEPVVTTNFLSRFKNWLKESFDESAGAAKAAPATPAGALFTKGLLSVHQSKEDGRWRVLAVYSNQFKDREKQIVSEAAHKEYVEAAEDGRALYPDLHLWHAGPDTKWGTVETVSYVGGFAVAGGVVDPGKEHVALKVKELADKGEVAVSFAFYGLLGPDGTYHLYRPYEISPLPVGSEANAITGIDLALISKENGMAFTDKKKGWLRTHFGFTDTQIAEAEKSFEGMTTGLKALGVEYKEAAETPPPTPPPAPQPPPSPPDPAPTPPPPNPAQFAMGDVVSIASALGDLATVVKGLKEQVDNLSKPETIQKAAEDLIVARVSGAQGGHVATQATGNVVQGVKESQDDFLAAAFGAIGLGQTVNAPPAAGGGAIVGAGPAALAPSTAEGAR